MEAARATPIIDSVLCWTRMRPKLKSGTVPVKVGTCSNVQYQLYHILNIISGTACNHRVVQAAYTSMT